MVALLGPLQSTEANRLGLEGPLCPLSTTWNNKVFFPGSFLFRYQQSPSAGLGSQRLSAGALLSGLEVAFGQIGVDWPGVRQLL